MQGVEPEFFDEVVTDPVSWLGMASTLFESAAILFANSHKVANSVSVAHMLRGYATENLLKGLWHQQAAGKDRATGSLAHPTGDPHDLVLWANRLTVPDTTVPVAPLRVLTRAVHYHGRYPIAKNHRKVGVVSLENLDPEQLWLRGHDEKYWPYVRAVAAQYDHVRERGVTYLDELLDHWQSSRVA